MHARMHVQCQPCVTPLARSVAVDRERDRRSSTARSRPRAWTVDRARELVCSSLAPPCFLRLPDVVRPRGAQVPRDYRQDLAAWLAWRPSQSHGLASRDSAPLTYRGALRVGSTSHTLWHTHFARVLARALAHCRVTPSMLRRYRRAREQAQDYVVHELWNENESVVVLYLAFHTVAC